jgi:tetratricopeptide (TPR) repeat protein
VSVTDPELRAAQLQTEAQGVSDAKARDAKYQQALAELDKVKTNDASGSAGLLRASILRAMNKPKEAIAAYEAALQARPDAGTRLELARLYLDQKDKANALKHLNEANKAIRGDISKQFEIAQMFRQAGATDQAEAAQKKASEMLKRQAELSAANNPAPVAPAPSAAGEGGAGGNSGNAASQPAAPAGNSSTPTTGR